MGFALRNKQKSCSSYKDEVIREENEDMDFTVDNNSRRFRLNQYDFPVDDNFRISRLDHFRFGLDDDFRMFRLYHFGFPVEEYFRMLQLNHFDFPVDDNFRMFEFKVRECALASSHVCTRCPYAHPGEKVRRRDPRKYQYSGSACPHYRNDACGRGDECGYAHGLFERWLHPGFYRTQMCKDGTHCGLRCCFLAHTPEQLRLLPNNSSPDSSSRQTMLRVFEQMIEWRRKRHPVRFNWSELHLSILRSYVLKLDLNFDSFLSFVKSFEDEFWYRVLGSSIEDASIVASFAQELEEFFVVPKQHQLFERDVNLKREELMAAFINLLLQLLHHRESSIDSLEDRIKHLEKVLRFLLTVVGDKSLICDEHEKVPNLLAEIEAVANEAGSLVHSLVFSTFADPIFKTMDELLCFILKHEEVLKTNIIKFSGLQPVITETIQLQGRMLWILF